MLAVACHAHTHKAIQRLDDLRPGLVDEIEQFFAHYNSSRGVAFEATGRGGPARARALLDEAVENFRTG